MMIPPDTPNLMETVSNETLADHDAAEQVDNWARALELHDVLRAGLERVLESRLSEAKTAPSRKGRRAAAAKARALRKMIDKEFPDRERAHLVAMAERGVAPEAAADAADGLAAIFGRPDEA